MASSTLDGPQSHRTSPTLLMRLRDLRNHASWQHFHEIYRPLLASVAARAGLADADVQDVVQETLVEVAKEMPAFRYDPARGRFKGWLLTIIRRRIANHWRARKYKVGDARVDRAEAMDPATLDANAGIFAGAKPSM